MEEFSFIHRLESSLERESRNSRWQSIFAGLLKYPRKYYPIVAITCENSLLTIIISVLVFGENLFQESSIQKKEH